MDAMTQAQPDGGTVLSDLDRDLLTFERQWWRYGGAKEDAVREQFGLSITAYYQALNALIDRPEALVHDPLLVKRLLRMRAARRRRPTRGAGAVNG